MFKVFLLLLLLYVSLSALVIFLSYLFLKKAVKNGVLEALEEYYTNEDS